MDAPGSLLAPCFNPQKASDNYLRLCQLIALLCGDLFRDILSRYIKPTNLRSELDNNKQKLVNIFNKQQQDQIYPATGNKLLTAKDFDIPIIYILLRNICNIPSHKTGWGNHPAKGDNSIAAGIEIIRLTRNSILAHSTNGMIEDPVFEKHWKELRNVVVQIEKELTGSELYKRGVDFLHSCNLTSVRTEAYDNGEKSKQDGVERIYDKRSARFAEFFDEIAESVPVEKTARLKDFIQNSCKAEDITSLKEAMSPRDCLRYLRDAKLFTSSYVIFVQYLFKRIDCKEQFAECYKYAEEQEALCFYEKPPANGYKNVLFHVKGNLSDYSSERITEIRETVADLLKCTSEEILIGGACPSTSFLLVLSIKDAYSCKLLTLEQCDKDKLTKLDIDYIIVDLIMINLEPSKEFGWNIYFDPKHFTREDENMHLQEKISTSSPSQHITTLFEKGSPTNEDSVSGCPTVTLNPVHLALQDELVEIKATIRGFPKCQSVTWMKDNQRINTTDPKYEGSIDSCEFPVLCIKEVKEEDTGVYKVIARNELGEGESSEDLEVIGNSGVFSTSKQEHGLRLFEHQSAIERLSLNDPKLIQSTCDIMNRVCSKGKDLHKMIEKFGDEKKLNQAPINEETHYRAQRTERLMRYADRRFSDNADSEIHYRAQRTERPMRYADRRVSDSADLEIHYRAQRTERSMRYADRRISDSSDSETYYRSERPERPMLYADRRFNDKGDSETYYRSERPMLYADRRFNDKGDSVISESFFNTRITTRSGEIEPIRFHEVCDPEIMMHDNYKTAKQSNPYGNGMCFMNRPMKLEELIHIYGHSFPNALFRESRPKIKIGLTNTDPEEIREAVHQKKYYVRGLEEIKCFSDDTTDIFHMYVCLCSNATLSICVNGFPEHIYKNQEISLFNSIWLVIEPYGIDLISILNN